jgi:hypothetical protein
MEAQAGELRFARHFSDNMVLQRDQPVQVKGFAEKGAAVSVSFAGQTRTVTAEDDGIWAVTLDPMPASEEPQNLSAVSSAGNDKAELRNILVGDVILFARQTSIDISLGRDEAGRKAAGSDRHNPLFRAISIRTLPEASPRRDLVPEATTGWTVISKDAALKMSAAAYYFGRELAVSGGVPVGVVDVNLGPAFAISWLSREALEETERLYGKSDVPAQLSRFDKLLSLAGTGEPVPKGEVISTNFTSYAIFPSGGYNAVLNPLRGTALKAVLVELGNNYPYMIYAQLEQGSIPCNRDELNRAYVQTYDLRKNGFRMEPVTVPRIPRVWRDAFGRRDLPVGMIMPPGSDLNTLGQHHREMRELLRLTALENKGVGVVLPGSGNTPLSGQPDDEWLLASRCLSWVDGAVYGKAGVPATGPLFDRMEGNFNEAVIHFKEGTAKGLRAEGEALNYFEAASVEGDYSPVKAMIDGEVVRLKSDSVPRIVRVRYNWNSRPNQGLVNAAGLPAIPFRSEKAEHQWFIRDQDSDLPEEYFTPANKWKMNDVTLVNGQLKTFGYGNFAGWLGPVGIKTGPFGPNMGVREVKAGSPAEGKILEGDVIYSANGKMLGDKAWEVMAEAITESETREAGGRLVLGLRRGRTNMDVEVTLEVMGTYSSTAPYDCPKTEKIISDLEKWVVENGAGAGFLNSDALFMLATGNPGLQGYVRRIIYKMIATPVPPGPVERTKSGKSWHNSAEALLLGEYYLATGDRNVLPYLKHVCDKISASQDKVEGGWRHDAMGAPSYGMMPNAGLPGVIGMHHAIQAGLEIDRESYALGVKRFADRRAETGYLIYGSGACQRDVPEPFNPVQMAAGTMTTYNGGLSAAGILMGFTGNYRAAHLCSLISTYAWNNTYEGHGGNFWNNFWSPLGAYSHGKPAFVEFWKKYRWYRECNRMFDGSLIQHEDGKVGAGTGIVLVAPRKRLQIVGAPVSPFSTSAPEFLKPAVDAYWKRDYAGCGKLVEEIVASGVVGKNERPTVEFLARAARDMQESISEDLQRVNRLVEAGGADAAKADLVQLKGVMPAGDERLAALEKAYASLKPAVGGKAKAGIAPAAGPVREKRDWVCLVREETGTPRSRHDKKYDDITIKPDQPSPWRMKIVESLAQAPEGWTSPKFDDAGWTLTTLPISWRLYHTALFRTTFTVKDKKEFDGLRLRAWVYMQQGIEIHINGELVGKINNLEEKTGDIDAEFKESALKCIRNGENTLAVSTRQNWRWGMLFMFVYNDGFDFNLDARVKQAAVR